MPKPRTSSRRSSSGTRTRTTKTPYQKLEDLSPETVRVTVGIDYKLAACYQSVGNQVAISAEVDRDKVKETLAVCREIVEEQAGDMISDTKATVVALTTIRDELE